ERALGELVAAGGSVAELDALARREEEHGVLANDVAAAQRLHADLPGGPLADRTGPGEAHRPGVLPARLGHDLGEAEGGPARSVLLQAVVELEHLGVPAGTEDAAEERGGLEHDVYADRHVGRHDDGDTGRGAIETLALDGGEAGGP